MRTISLLIALTSLTLSNAFAADGKTVYNMTCMACHQADGNGMAPVFPPLAESEWVNGPIENLIRIQLRGLQGPIKVKGVEFSGAMTPQAHLSDEDIAAVLTFVRSNFGNSSSAITADQVKAFRSEVGQPMLTVADLIDPATVTVEPEASENDESTPKEPQTIGKMEHKASLSMGLVIGFLAWAALCIVPAITGLGRGSGK